MVNEIIQQRNKIEVVRVEFSSQRGTNTWARSLYFNDDSRFSLALA